MIDKTKLAPKFQAIYWRAGLDDRLRLHFDQRPGNQSAVIRSAMERYFALMVGRLPDLFALFSDAELELISLLGSLYLRALRQEAESRSHRKRKPKDDRSMFAPDGRAMIRAITDEGFIAACKVSPERARLLKDRLERLHDFDKWVLLDLIEVQRNQALDTLGEAAARLQSIQYPETSSNL